jgi:hypothetical protein
MGRWNNPAPNNEHYLLYFSSNRVSSSVGLPNTYAEYDFNYADNQWHHYIVLFSDNNLQLYVDGTLVAETPFSGTLNSTSQLFTIGAYSFDPSSFISNNHWNGQIDDLSAWNRALTPEEVQELYTLEACTFAIYDTVYTYETIYDTVTTYITVTDTLLIDITFTGFEGQPSWLNTVTVFPNPASDHITIDYGNFALMAGYNTIITNAAGATVYSSAVNSQQVEVDINAWGAMGVYYMSIYDVNGALVAVRHIVLE